MITPAPSLKRPQQVLGVNPVVFDPARSAVHLEACRVHHAAGDAGLGQAAVEAKTVIAGLEYALDLDGLASAHLRVAPASLKEFDQWSGITPVYPAAGDLPRDRVTHGQQPS